MPRMFSFLRKRLFPAKNHVHVYSWYKCCPGKNMHVQAGLGKLILTDVDIVKSCL